VRATRLLTKDMFGTRPFRLWCLGVSGFLIATAAPAADCGKPPDLEFLSGFLAGEYRVVGQSPDAKGGYVGRLVLKAKANGFEVSREIGAVTTKGTGAIETAGEDCPVLRIRFTFDAAEYEGTFLWRSDLDNYPRLTGYIYRRGGGAKSPGLEAWFPVAALTGE
jgi:hypothetical protein